MTKKSSKEMWLEQELRTRCPPGRTFFAALEKVSTYFLIPLAFVFSEEVMDSGEIYDVGYYFTWGSVKRIKGSSKSVFYILTWHVKLESADGTCEVPQSSEYSFLNKVEKKVPVYLGILKNE